MRELASRFRALLAAIKTVVVKEDGFDLVFRLRKLRSLTLMQERQFAFQTDASKVESFNQWFKQQVEAGLYAPSPGTPPDRPWLTPYIDSAYRKGLRNAYLSTRDRGVWTEQDTAEEFVDHLMFAPESTSKVRLLATRAFQNLKGIGEAAAAEMNRIFADGLIQGLGAIEIAKNLREKLDEINQVRAMRLARTEIIHAHAEGQLDAFEELGVEELGIIAEWSTAKDERVCPRCAEREGKRYKVSEARGLIPLHPNCRCTWVPFIQERRGRSIRPRMI